MFNEFTKPADLMLAGKFYYSLYDSLVPRWNDIIMCG